LIISLLTKPASKHVLNLTQLMHRITFMLQPMIRLTRWIAILNLHTRLARLEIINTLHATLIAAADRNA
jgi:hypothetical protein